MLSFKTFSFHLKDSKYLTKYRGEEYLSVLTTLARYELYRNVWVVDILTYAEAESGINLCFEYKCRLCAVTSRFTPV
jgi:hypothetical protein